ncbi:FAD-dependent thymidylate synthase [Patescibacteria group bacterium]|nr:FAD-dependent thymidylate synthase [Patescibacteria group bacterium]
MSALEEIVHTEGTTPEGATVLVLNTSAHIDPEAQAMLAALHSRSIGGIRSHLKVLAEKGADNFMSKFYVGYGHKSIGDLGSVTVFIEGISMLAAKALQDLRLYNGQEASTRYIDFAKQPFIDPIGTSLSRAAHEELRAFYLHGLEALPPYLKGRYPIREGESQTMYDKAILARAFDTMRAFLPAGASTNLAWHGPLRVFSDRLGTLRHHPLFEVRHIGAALESALQTAYPNSFSTKQYTETEAYLETAMPMLAYYRKFSPEPFAVTRDSIDRTYLKEYRVILETRPPKTELPRMLDEAGELQFEYLLDFGSFRDIQRHRAVAQRIPLLTTAYGFEEWYLEEMPDALRDEARTFLSTYESRLSALYRDPDTLQYYIPMGYRTANRLTGTLPGLVYLVELRSGSTVHPTLRTLALSMGGEIEARLRETGLRLHLDTSETRFDVRRGSHDIVMQ